MLAAVLATASVAPSAAQAHGPVAPVAIDYVARVRQLPPGLDAKVVDGDQRMWLQVPADETAVVLDYRGAPYLRFTSAGVAVNHNSVIYYLIHTPFALLNTLCLVTKKLRNWVNVTSFLDYFWM